MRVGRGSGLVGLGEVVGPQDRAEADLRLPGSSTSRRAGEVNLATFLRIGIRGLGS